MSPANPSQQHDVRPEPADDAAHHPAQPHDMAREPADMRRTQLLAAIWSAIDGE